VASKSSHVPTSMTSVSWSPNLVLKSLAVLLLYVLVGHPLAYVTLWERNEWYVLLLGIVVVPILLVWSVQVLVWRVRVSSSTIEIRSLRGVIKKPVSDVTKLDRTFGRILIAFRDGAERVIPTTVGDLDPF
jgi:hypothetical protein